MAADYFTNPQFGVDKGKISNVNLGGFNALAPSPPGSSATPKSVSQVKTSQPILRYPIAKLNQFDDYVEIKIIRYKRQGVNVGANNFRVTTATENVRDQRFREILATIQLPMPREVPTDTNQVSWGGGELNSLEAFGIEALTRVIQSNNLPAATVAEIQNAVSLAQGGVVSGNAQGAIQAGIVSKLLQSFGSNVSAQNILSRATGQILNPNLELLFSGVNLRSFPFTFDLAPRDPVESTRIKDIIRAFKKSMAAKTRAAGNGAGVGLFISAPDVFEISYKSGGKNHPFLNRFKPCALTSINVNYTGAGSYATYPDATPVHMIMQLNFSELNPIYAEDYDAPDPEGTIGVGY